MNKFQAWKFGPVLNSIYHECKEFGGDGIDNFLSPDPLPQDSDVNKIIDFVWKTYGEKSATLLSGWTHEKGGPWYKTIMGSRFIPVHKRISDESIKEYFKNHLTWLKLVAIRHFNRLDNLAKTLIQNMIALVTIQERRQLGARCI